MWTSQRLELEGGDVQLFCRAEGRPNPKVTWFDRDNKTITSDNKQFEVCDHLRYRFSYVTNLADDFDFPVLEANYMMQICFQSLHAEPRQV